MKNTTINKITYDYKRTWKGYLTPVEIEELFVSGATVHHVNRSRNMEKIKRGECNSDWVYFVPAKGFSKQNQHHKKE